MAERIPRAGLEDSFSARRPGDESLAEGGLRASVKPADDDLRLLRSILPVLIIVSMIGPLASIS